MEAQYIITTTVAIVSLCVSLVTAYFTFVSQRKSLCHAAQQDHLKFLQEIDRILVDRPDLWSIYDSPLGTPPDPKPLGRQEAFIYLHFNLFTLIHDFYDSSKLSRADRPHRHAWYNYIEQFFAESSMARSLFKDQKTQALYPAKFASWCLNIIERVEGNMGKDHHAALSGKVKTP